MVSLRESLKVKTSEQKFRKSWDLNGVDFCQRKRLANIVSLLSGHSWLLYISLRANATNILGRDTHIAYIAFFDFFCANLCKFLKRTNLQKNSAQRCVSLLIGHSWFVVPLSACQRNKYLRRGTLAEGLFGANVGWPEIFRFYSWEQPFFFCKLFLKVNHVFLSHSLIWHLGKSIEC